MYYAAEFCLDPLNKSFLFCSFASFRPSIQMPLMQENCKSSFFLILLRYFTLFRLSLLLSSVKLSSRVPGDGEKRTPWWNQEVKEAIRVKKDAFKAWLQDRSSSDLQSRYTEARKAATSAVNKSKEKSWEEFGRRLNSNYFSANKVFWQTIRRWRGKRSSFTYSIKDSDNNILTDENEILSRWREYFEGLLNPVKASTRDTSGEDEVFHCSRSGNGN